MLLINNPCLEPAYNLALEEYLLTEFEQEALCLWRNSPAIIIGRYQNTLAEIDPDYLQQQQIPVIRRLTGGGAVFHDLGNINYTLITNAGENDISNYAKFTAPVISYLATLGVEAELSGRNDLQISGLKCCGNAQTVRNGRLLHHGCLLFNADLSRLSRALRPHPAKIDSKGIKSVRSRVTNIAEHLAQPLSAEQFLDGLRRHYLATAQLQPYQLTAQDRAAISSLVKDKYATWEWNFGKSPAYGWQREVRFPFGLVELRMQVNRGIIEQAALYGDFFGQRDLDELYCALIGLPHRRAEVQAALAQLPLAEFISGLDAQALLELMF